MSYPIAAIFFDFVGVLLCRRQDYQSHPLVDAIDAAIGKVCDDLRFKAAIQETYGLIDTEFVNALQAIVNKYVPFEPLWAWLPELRQHYKLAIINNGTWLTYPFFNTRFKLDTTFDTFISSAKEGVCKPDERIYHQACERVGVAAAESLFMDDDLENVQGARRIGMHGIHWADPTNGFETFVGFIQRTNPRIALPNGHDKP